MDKIVFNTPKELAREAARHLIDVANDAVAARRRFTLALAGGSAARQLYPLLSATDLPWRQTHLFWGDERAVPPEHPDSNFGLAQQLLLSRVPIPEDNVHRMRAEHPDPSTAVTLYERELARVLGAGYVLDVVHVGMGPDGHICSLFPGHPALEEKRRPVLYIDDSPKAPAERLTLSFGPLLAAREVWVHVTGPDKADAVREALENPDSMTPAAILTRYGREVTWLLDREAAYLLSDS